MSVRSPRPATVAALLVATAAAMLPATASATYPGQNGAIIYGVARYDKHLKDYGYLGPGALYSVLANGLNATALPHDDSYNDFEAAWSPDGRQIAWGAVAGGKYDGIYVGEPASPEPKLVAMSSNADAPAWTPDGRSILYMDYVKGILTVPADGSAKPRVLLRNPKGWQALAPSSTPDAATIVFARQKVDRAGSMSSSEVWAMDASGANPRRIVANDAAHRFPSLPDVAPTGTQIVFEADTSRGISALWTASLDGSAPRVLTTAPNGRFYSAATWAPDGTKLAASLSAGSPKKGSKIVTVDVATGVVTTVRSASKALLLNPSWQALPVG